MTSAVTPLSHLHVLCAALIALCCSTAGAQQRSDWPILPEPGRLASFEVGRQIKLSGVPVRIKGYVSDQSISALMAWYRKELGGRWVENKLASKTVIAQRQGEFLVTVELEPMLGGMLRPTTKVVTSVMNLREATLRQSAAGDAFGHWTARLPLTSKVLSHITESATNHDSLHLAAINSQSLAYNAQHFRDVFRQLGYQEERGTPETSPRRPSVKPTTGAQQALWFTGPDAEAVVNLRRDEWGRTTVVLIQNRSKR